MMRPLRDASSTRGRSSERLDDADAEVGDLDAGRARAGHEPRAVRLGPLDQRVAGGGRVVAERVLTLSEGGGDVFDGAVGRWSFMKTTLPPTAHGVNRKR